MQPKSCKGLWTNYFPSYAHRGINWNEIMSGNKLKWLSMGDGVPTILSRIRFPRCSSVFAAPFLLLLLINSSDSVPLSDGRGSGRRTRMLIRPPNNVTKSSLVFFITVFDWWCRYGEVGLSWEQEEEEEEEGGFPNSNLLSMSPAVWTNNPFSWWTCPRWNQSPDALRCWRRGRTGKMPCITKYWSSRHWINTPGLRGKRRRKKKNGLFVSPGGDPMELTAAQTQTEAIKHARNVTPQSHWCARV